MINSLTKIFISLIAICKFYPVYTQEFRVKAIQDIVQYHNRSGKVDTIRKNFYYRDSILTDIVKKRSLSNFDSKYKLLYQPNLIQIKSGIRIDKEFHFDSLNRITKYISNGYNYVIEYDIHNRPIALVRNLDTLAIIYYSHFPRYKKTIDSLVMPTRVIYKYTYDYRENILTAISNWTGGLWVNYYFDYAPDFMIVTLNGDGLKYIHEFYYKDKGLLVKEIIKVFAPRLIETHSIDIEYEKAKGNEDFLFKIYNWRYNYYIGVKTYYEFEDVRY